MCNTGATRNTRPVIRRTASGAIDTEFYARRARAERAKYLQSLMDAVARCVLSPWRYLNEKLRAGVRRHELNAMSARELRDIGISRSDVDAIVDGSYFADVTRVRSTRK